MKKIIFISMLLLSSSLYAADSVKPEPKQVSGTAAAGVSLNMAEGLVNATKSSIGINGFSFRFIGADKKGFEIPFSCQLTNNDSLSNSSRSYNTNFSISAGYRFISPVFMNEFIRVNVLPGIIAGYSGSWAETNYTDYPYDNNVNARHNFMFGIAAGLEVEVPIGRVFSLPADTICLAAGISINFAGNFTTNYVNGRYDGTGTIFTVNTGTFGSGINSLGIRYYL